MAAPQAPRRVRESGRRRDRARATLRGFGQNSRRDRHLETHLARQSLRIASRQQRADPGQQTRSGEKSREAKGYEEARAHFTTDSICASAEESSFFSESKLARRIASGSGTHSTSSTSLSCGVSVPPT